MATFAPASGTIRFSDIKSAFSLATVSLAERRSKTYWRADAFRGTLPSATIKITDFYSKGGSSPVTPSSVYHTSNNGTTTGATLTVSYIVPLYYKMDIDLRAAGGGGGGGGGATFAFNGSVTSVGNGGAGASGGNTSFGSYVSYGGGAGSAVAGANGAGSDGIAYGGAGGASGWASAAAGQKGGDGGYSRTTVYSPINGGSGPAPGSVVTIVVGAGGGGGGGYGNGSAGSPGRYGEMAVYVS